MTTELSTFFARWWYEREVMKTKFFTMVSYTKNKREKKSPFLDVLRMIFRVI